MSSADMLEPGTLSDAERARLREHLARLREISRIVTFNLSDFPAEVLRPYGIEATHPDKLIVALASDRADEVLGVMRRHRTSLRKPPKSPKEYIKILRRAGLKRTARLAAGRTSDL